PLLRWRRSSASRSADGSVQDEASVPRAPVSETALTSSVVAAGPIGACINGSRHGSSLILSTARALGSAEPTPEVGEEPLDGPDRRRAAEVEGPRSKDLRTRGSLVVRHLSGDARSVEVRDLRDDERAGR